jgi:ribosomal-protein-alanine N-acetyltransferase
MESQRLSFRKINSKDFNFLFRYHSDPINTQYLPSGTPYTKIHVENYLNNRIEHWKKHLFGTFMILLKSNSRVVGYCGLEFIEDKEFIDIRYGIIREIWGKGIAKEAAQTCIDYGFNDLNLDTIFGAVVHDNIPSLIILEKIGMKPCKGFDFYGDAVIYFRITKSEYLNSLN